MLEKLSGSRALVAFASIATIIGIGLFQKVEASSTANATATSNSNIITSIGITKIDGSEFWRCRAERRRQNDGPECGTHRRRLGRNADSRSVRGHRPGKPRLLGQYRSRIGHDDHGRGRSEPDASWSTPSPIIRLPPPRIRARR